MNSSFSLLVFCLVGLRPAISWTVPKLVSTNLPPSRAKGTLSFTRIYAQEQEDGDVAAVAEAQRLKEKAEKVRLEVQEMEKSFVEQKLVTLEKLLEKQSRLSDSERQDIQDKIDRLKNRQNPPKEQTVAVTPNETIMEDEEELTLDALLAIFEEEQDFVGELSEDDRKAVEEIQSLFLEMENILKNNFTELMEVDEVALLKEITQELDKALEGNVTRPALDFFKFVAGVVSGFKKFIPAEVYEKLLPKVLEEVREGNKEYEEIKEISKKDPHYEERLGAIEKFIPEQMLQSKIKVNQTDIDEFVDQVMKGNADVFEMKSNPRKLGRFYVLEGTPTVADGNVLVDRLDKQLMASDLHKKLQFFYCPDVTASIGLSEVQLMDAVEPLSDDISVDQFLNLTFIDLQPASLLVTPYVKAEPLSTVGDRALLASLAILSAARFTGSCYNPDGDLLEQVANGFSNPTVLLALLGLTVAHELGHFIAAALNKVSMQTTYECTNYLQGVCRRRFLL